MTLYACCEHCLQSFGKCGDLDAGGHTWPCPEACVAGTTPLPDDPTPEVSDELIDAFDEGWRSVPGDKPGDRRRAGLARVIPLILADALRQVDRLLPVSASLTDENGRVLSSTYIWGSLPRDEVRAILKGETK